MEKAQHQYEDVLMQSDVSRMASRIRRAYAESLLDVAEKQGAADAISEQFDSLLNDVFRAVPRLEETLDSSALGRNRKDELIAKVFGGRATPLFLSFLRLLNRNDRLGLLRMIAVGYQSLRDERENRIRVLVEAAAPLSDEQRDKLTATLAAATGKTPVVVVRAKPELIGGLVVHIGAKVYDTSVRTKLQTLRNVLTDRGSYAIQRERDRFSIN